MSSRISLLLFGTTILRSSPELSYLVCVVAILVLRQLLDPLVVVILCNCGILFFYGIFDDLGFILGSP